MGASCSFVILDYLGATLNEYRCPFVIRLQYGSGDATRAVGTFAGYDIKLRTEKILQAHSEIHITSFGRDIR